MGLVYQRNTSSPPLQAYVDAAFADCDDFKSTAGWVFMVQCAVVAHDSITIKRVVTSSTEAECAALTVIGKENSCQRKMCMDLMGVPELAPTPVQGDNTTTCFITCLKQSRKLETTSKKQSTTHSTQLNTHTQ